MKSIKIAISMLLVLIIAGCGGRVQPIMQVEDTPVAYDLQKKEVQTAIITAVTQRGWNVKNAGENEVTAKLIIRSHTAEISIPYSEKYYSIEYVDSDNLNASDGKIHRNYNRWINNLNVDIQKQLANIALAK
jgi:hypothetical protein